MKGEKPTKLCSQITPVMAKCKQLLFYMILASTICLLLQLYQHSKLISALSLSVVQKQTQFENQQLDSQVERGVDQVLKNVRTCLKATNMAESANETIALANAKEFYQQYSKVIPTEFLSKYSSHCWKMKFNVEIMNGSFYKGQLGKYPFRMEEQKSLQNQIMSLKKLFEGNFSSDVICLPNVFLAGFPKCGSTYGFCFLQSLVHLSTGLQMGASTKVVKEPHYWVRTKETKYVKMPKPTDLAEYVLNYLPGLFKINALKNKKVVLIDGTPNMLFDSPQFHKKQSNTSNYCLLPSAIPELLPKSKYIIIVRNPLKMLYSAFWFSITRMIELPRNVQLIGPGLFHDRIKAKIDRFNDCMRDPDNLEISMPCNLYVDSDYDSCIKKRLHLLDQCVHTITFNLFSKELPTSGRSRVEMGLFYTHIRKLLTVVPRDKVMVLTLEQLAKEPEVIAEQMLKFLGYPSPKSILNEVKLITHTCTKNSQETIPYKHDPQLKMREDTKSMILKFYKPFNSLLADLLHDDRFLWND